MLMINIPLKNTWRFLLIIAPNAYLISKLEGAVLNGRQCLKKRGPHFRERRVIHMKFQIIDLFSEQITTVKYYYDI